MRLPVYTYHRLPGRPDPVPTTFRAKAVSTRAGRPRGRSLPPFLSEVFPTVTAGAGMTLAILLIVQCIAQASS